MSTADIARTRHARKGRTVPPSVAERLDAERRAARSAYAAGDVAEAWRLLERTHILSQPWPWLHIRSHVDMLVLAVRTRDVREFVGQVMRTAVAGPASALGRYPLGNTGRANVPATRPMPVPDDLAAATLEFRTRASGIARSVPIRLLTPQEMDDAVHRNAAYRTPGH